MRAASAAHPAAIEPGIVNVAVTATAAGIISIDRVASGQRTAVDTQAASACDGNEQAGLHGASGMALAVEIPKTNMRTAKSVAERESAASVFVLCKSIPGARTESNRDGLDFFIVAGKGRRVGGLSRTSTGSRHIETSRLAFFDQARVATVNR